MNTEKYAKQLILLFEQKLLQVRDEKIKAIAEIYQVKKERVSQRKDLRTITNLESRQVTSQKLVLEFEQTQRKAQDYELEKRKKQLDYFKNQIFSFFQVGSTWRSRKSSSVQSKGFMKFSSLKKDIFRYKII